MAWEWLINIKNIADIVSSLGELVKNNKATKDLLIRELKLNIKSFETAQKTKKIGQQYLKTTNENKCLQLRGGGTLAAEAARPERACGSGSGVGVGWG